MVFIGILIVVAMVTWQMIILAILLFIVIVFLREIYIPTARSVKRIESAGKQIFIYLTPTLLNRRGSFLGENFVSIIIIIVHTSNNHPN